MTADRFDALAQLANIAVGTRTWTALKHHYVHGFTRAEAARMAGVTPQVVSNACRKIELAQSRLPALLDTARTAMGEPAWTLP